MFFSAETSQREPGGAQGAHPPAAAEAASSVSETCDLDQNNPDNGILLFW